MSRTLAVVVAIAAVGLVGAAVLSAPDSSSDVAVDIAAAPSGDTDDATADQPDADTNDAVAAAAALEDLGPRQELTDIDGWLQAGDTEAIEELIGGKVSVIQIWTFGCFNCKNTLPNLRGLRDEYADNANFQIVGIHSPEFEHEEDPDNILAAARDLDVTWPIALDTRQTNFFDWQGSRGFWPRTYVVDQDGNVRFDHIGEGAYDELNQTVATLLAAADQQAR